MTSPAGGYVRLRPWVPGRAVLLLMASVCVVLSGGVEASQEGTESKSRPNVLLIMADDMGYSDLGAYGGEIETPNLDRLSEEGMRFSQFYVTPRCSPTRAALLTGLDPRLAGLGHLPGDWATARRVRDVFDSPAYQDHLRRRAATIAELLRQDGYRTFMTGKWHLGYDRGHWPTEHGFDRFYGTLGGGVYFWPPMIERRVIADTARAVPDSSNWGAEAGSWYSTDAFTDRAVSFLRNARQSGEPFFMYVAHIAPHFPLQAFRTGIERYENRYDAGWDSLRQRRYERLVNEGLIRADWALPARPPEVPAWTSADRKDHWTRKMATYAAQVDRMDQNIGRLLDALDTLGVAENTIVMFLSDNGAVAAQVDRSAPDAPVGSPQSFTSYGQPWATLSNAPFRGYKKQTYEGGIASPLIVRWPGVVKAGSTTDAVAHVTDLVPTVLDAADVAYPDTFDGRDLFSLSGRSLRPVVQGEEWGTPRTLFWAHEGNRGVRHGRWKLVGPYSSDWELYDMEADRLETSDLSSSNPQTVEDLAQRYRQWADRVGVGSWKQVEEQSD